MSFFFSRVFGTFLFPTWCGQTLFSQAEHLGSPQGGAEVLEDVTELLFYPERASRQGWPPLPWAWTAWGPGVSSGGDRGTQAVCALKLPSPASPQPRSEWACRELSE